MVQVRICENIIINFYFNQMKHLIIYTTILLVVTGFIVYKMLEGIMNIIFNISDVDEKLDVQLNIFSIERVMLKRMNKLL